jgi:hypothetical protein
MGLLSGGYYSQGSGGDIIDLQDVGCSVSTQGGPATAEIVVYSENDTLEGQVWTDDNGLIFFNTLVTPVSNIQEYQMKWDGLSGTSPYLVGTSAAEGVWQPLTIAGGDFVIAWRVGTGPGTAEGAVTVSIRKGTGPQVLATATWDGFVELSGKGK